MDLDERAALVRKVTIDRTHTFYRDLYKILEEKTFLEITSENDWRSIPFLTKENLLSRSLSQRTYIPLKNIDHLRPSSGTSGRGALFSPRTPLRLMEYKLQYHSFERPVLGYTVPAMPHWHEQFQKAHGEMPRTICFDPKFPEACARLARDAGVDSLSLFAFHIPLIAPHLMEVGIANDIKFIEIAGEACSHSLYDYIKKTFPNATIIPFYGSSEVEDSPIGMPCRPITGEEPLALYHKKPSHYHEIRDSESGQILNPVSGTEGELVITAYPGEPSSFPLLRFLTGDTIRVIDTICREHGTWSFSVLGRTAMDFIKIHGGVLRADEIERVLRTMPEEVSDRFQVVYTEHSSAMGPQLSITLKIEPRKPLKMEEIAVQVSRLLRVSPIMTYADGAEEGRYAHLVCEKIETVAGSKTRRIVRT